MDTRLARGNTGRDRDQVRGLPHLPLLDAGDSTRGPQRPQAQTVPNEHPRMDLRVNSRASREAHMQIPPSSRGPQPRSTQLSPPLGLVRGERDPDEMNTKNTTSKISSPPSLTRAHYPPLTYILSYLLLLLLSCPHPPPLLTQPPQGERVPDEMNIKNTTPKILSPPSLTQTHYPPLTYILSYLLLLLLPCPHPPPLRTQPPQGGWIRDTTEEGIEPNPGPSVISKNINGITNSADTTFQYHKRNGLDLTFSSLSTRTGHTH